MAVRLPSDILDLEDEMESINVLVFGDSGSGKTPFAGSAKRGLILATERGLVSAKRRGSTAKVWPCHTWERFVKAKAWLERAGETQSGIPFDWVSVDSGTQLQTLLLQYILKTETAKTPSKRDIDIPQLQDHQKWQNQLKRTFEELVDLPVNLCVTALPMTITSMNQEGEEEEWILPQFLGKEGAIAWAITGKFHCGGRVKLTTNSAGKPVQRIYFSKDGAHWGRDRYSALGKFKDNLTLDGLAARVKATATKDAA